MRVGAFGDVPVDQAADRRRGRASRRRASGVTIATRLPLIMSGCCSWRNSARFYSVRQPSDGDTAARFLCGQAPPLCAQTLRRDALHHRGASVAVNRLRKATISQARAENVEQFARTAAGSRDWTACRRPRCRAQRSRRSARRLARALAQRGEQRPMQVVGDDRLRRTSGPGYGHAPGFDVGWPRTDAGRVAERMRRELRSRSTAVDRAAARRRTRRAWRPRRTRHREPMRRARPGAQAASPRATARRAVHRGCVSDYVYSSPIASRTSRIVSLRHARARRAAVGHDIAHQLGIVQIPLGALAQRRLLAQHRVDHRLLALQAADSGGAAAVLHPLLGAPRRNTPGATATPGNAPVRRGRCAARVPDRSACVRIFSSPLRLLAQQDRVVVALRHLLAVQPGQLRRFGQQRGGLDQNRAVRAFEIPEQPLAICERQAVASSTSALPPAQRVAITLCLKPRAQLDIAFGRIAAQFFRRLQRLGLEIRLARQRGG